MRTTQDSDLIAEMKLEKDKSLLWDLSADFAGDEDTILSKLEWYCRGSEVPDRQWRDIPGVLKTRAGELELDYMHKWARELKVSDLLERALEEWA